METPGARELLLRLLLAADEGVLGSAQAVKGCALFGISENNTRVALARLVTAGLAEVVGRGAYRLGPEGRALGADVTAWRDAERRVRAWQGGWVAVLTAALGKADRSNWRIATRALALVGLRELEAGLYLRPDNVAGGVAAARERLRALGLPAHAPVFAAADLDPAREKAARRLWDAAALERGYREGRRKLEKSLLRLPKLAVDEAAREAYLAGDAAIHQLIFDPMLPEPLVDVGERRAFADAVRQYDDAGRRIWRRFYKD